MFLKHKWNPPKDMKTSFAGRNIIVTGANIGVGFEASVKFVALGASKVILGVRDINKGNEAKAQIEARTGRKGCIEVWQLDMLDYSSIQAFASRATSELDHLDIAVLNAGIVAATYEQSEYGWERSLQVNTLSTTLLGLLLLPKLRDSKTADFTPVLEVVSSGSHYNVNLTAQEKQATDLFAQYNKERPLHHTSEGSRQYAITKLFLMYAWAHIASKAVSAKTGKPGVYVTSVCPGATRSSIARDISGVLLRAALWVFSTFFQRTTEEGSRTYISGATLGEKSHGRFWRNDVIEE